MTPATSNAQCDPVRFTARAVRAFMDGEDRILAAALDEGKRIEIIMPAGVSLLLTEAPEPRRKRTLKAGGAQ